MTLSPAATLGVAGVAIAEGVPNPTLTGLFIDAGSGECAGTEPESVRPLPNSDRDDPFRESSDSSGVDVPPDPPTVVTVDRSCRTVPPMACQAGLVRNCGNCSAMMCFSIASRKLPNMKPSTSPVLMRCTSMGWILSSMNSW